ncbi:hypothetical protein BLAT2472_170030 [Burkholderia latens]|uniref:hypothetical protein n=1 Tax=Burkholderia latens TaxID=488446 RepID=UPI0039A4BAA7
MMQPNYQETIGRVMNNVTFGLTGSDFSWWKYAVFIIVGASIWIAIPRYVAATKGGPQAANRATAFAAVGLLFCLTPLTAIIGFGLWVWTVYSALHIEHKANG